VPDHQAPAQQQHSNEHDCDDEPIDQEVGRAGGAGDPYRKDVQRDDEGRVDFNDVAIETGTAKHPIGRVQQKRHIGHGDGAALPDHCDCDERGDRSPDEPSIREKPGQDDGAPMGVWGAGAVQGATCGARYSPRR
jgi:hypothetical protein